MASWREFIATGIAKYAFEANGKYQISLKVNDEVEIEEFSSGWYKGTRVATGERGIFPANYILVEKELGDSLDRLTVVQEEKEPLEGRPKDGTEEQKDEEEGPLFAEIEHTIREWTNELQDGLCLGKTEEYYHVLQRLSVLCEWRRVLKLDRGQVPDDVRDLIKTSLIGLIEGCRKLKSGFMIPRNSTGEIVDETNTPLIEIYLLHKHMQMSLDAGTKIPKRAREFESVGFDDGTDKARDFTGDGLESSEELEISSRLRAMSSSTNDEFPGEGFPSSPGSSSRTPPSSPETSDRDSEKPFMKGAMKTPILAHTSRISSKALKHIPFLGDMITSSRTTADKVTPEKKKRSFGAAVQRRASTLFSASGSGGTSNIAAALAATSSIVSSGTSVSLTSSVPSGLKASQGDFASSSFQALLHQEKIDPKRRVMFLKPVRQPDPDSEHQLVLEFREAEMRKGDTMELYFSLLCADPSDQGSADKDGFLTEEFLVCLDENGCPGTKTTVEIGNVLKTVFKDIKWSELEKKLFLVCRVFRRGKLLISTSKNATSKDDLSIDGDEDDDERESGREVYGDLNETYRRPFGCAVWPLSEYVHLLNVEQIVTANLVIIQSTKAEDLNVIVRNLVLNASGIETYFHSMDWLAKDLDDRTPDGRSSDAGSILKKRYSNGATTDLEGDCSTKAITGPSITIVLKLLRARFSQQVVARFLNANAIYPIPRLFLGRVIEPSDVRNDLYVTLVGGDFQQDRKRSAKNIEVRLYVLSNRGEQIPVLVRGVGQNNHLSSEYRSTVYYHNNSPRFNENVRFAIPSSNASIQAQLEQCHILFLLYHASTNPDKTHPFAFAFLELTTQQGVVIGDGDHVLKCYKPLKDMDKGVDEIDPSIYLLHHKLNPDDGNRFGFPEANGDSHFHQTNPLQPGNDFPNGSSTAATSLVLRSKENLVIRTRLCSTVKTQRPELYELLRWRELKPQRLIDVLLKVSRVSESEIIKFLRPIFDVLMGVFASGEDDNVLQSAYSLFVSVLKILMSQYISFQPVLDSYVVDIFSKEKHCHKIYPVIMHQLRQLFEWLELLGMPDSPSLRANGPQRTVLINSTRCLSYIFKFIVYSRLEDCRRNEKPVVANEAFHQDLLELLYFVDAVMLKREPTWIQTAQTNAIKNFADIFPDLSLVFSASELGEIARGFLESIQPASSKTALNKLELTRRLCDTLVIQQKVARKRVMAAVVRMLQMHLKGTPEENLLCTCIIVKLVGVLQANNLTDTEDVWNLSILFPDILASFADWQIAPNPTVLSLAGVLDEVFENATTKTDLCTAMFCVVNLMTPEQMKYYLETVLANNERMSLHDFIRASLNTCKQVLFTQPYNDSWLIMNLLAIKAMIKIMTWVAPVMHAEIIGIDAFQDIQTELQAGASSEVHSSAWIGFFDLGFSLLRLDELDLENVSPQRREFVLARSGGVDSRLTICRLIKTSWNRLGGQQTQLAAWLTGILLEFCVNGKTHSEIEQLCRDMYFELLKREYTTTTAFQIVETKTIDAVDNMVKRINAMTPQSSSTATRQAVELFTIHLPNKVETDADLKPKQQQIFLSFLSQASTLFELLGELSRLPASPEYENDRVNATLQLMSYLEQTGRNDMYRKYASDLCGFHTGLGNYAEAAKTLVLQAQAQGEYLDDDSKNALISRAVDLFDQGMHWEEAIELLETNQRLRYQHVTYDYDALALILSRQARMFSDIIHKDRFYPSYFRVSFSPPSMTKQPHDENRGLLYRGNPLENLADFTYRLQMRYPKAVVTKFREAKEQSEDEEKQKNLAIYVQTVNPCHESEMENGGIPHGPNPIIPKQIVQNDLHNRVSWFNNVKSFRKRDGKTDNEFLDNWARYTYYKIEGSFPSTHRCAAIEKTVEIVLNPLQIAVSTIKLKNRQIRDSIDLHKDLQRRGANQAFTMLLNGVVDAAVSGGVVKNYTVFLTDEYRAKYPEILDHLTDESDTWIERLKQQLRLQMELLREGLSVHGRVCSQHIIPLHEFLLVRFKELEAILLPLLRQGELTISNSNSE